MKKIANNAKLGRFSMILNGLIFILVIVLMVFIMKFDKANIVLLNETPHYNAAMENERNVSKPLKQAQEEVKYYAHKLDTLKLQTPETKELIQFQKEEVEKTMATLAKKEHALDSINALIAHQAVLLEPIQKQYELYSKDAESARGTYNVVLMLTCLAFLAKVLVFAFWKYKSLENLRISSSWMMKSNAPYMAFVAWLVPIYNLFKPYALFSEIWNETEFILKDKNVLQENEQADNNDFNLGLWWALFLIVVVLYTLVLNSTFFSEGGAMFVKFSHQTVAIIAVVLWAIYLAFETILMRRFNKLSQLMYANQVKFE